MILLKKKLIPFTLLFLLILVGGMLYSNRFTKYPSLEQKTQNTPHVVDPVFSSNEDNIEENRLPKPDIENVIANKNVDKPAPTENQEQSPIATSSDPITTESNNSPTSPNAEIANTIQQKVGEPIESADLLQAVSIILKKLSVEEIQFLLGFSNCDYTMEEYIEIRKLLFRKLSAEDIDILNSMAQKYGKELEIFDPDLQLE